VGVFEGVGVLVVVWVGGTNRAVCVRAAAAVSKIMVSTAPGSGRDEGDPALADGKQADRIKMIPGRSRRLRMNFGLTGFPMQIILQLF